MSNQPCIRYLVLISLLGLSLTACRQAATDESMTPVEQSPVSEMTTQDDTVVSLAAETSATSSFVSALQSSGVADSLGINGPYTIFAPSNEAFEALPKDIRDRIMADPEELAAVLRYHVIQGELAAADVAQLLTAQSLQGEDLNISANDQGVRINSATVIQTDLKAENGYIHVIDKVLIPE